MSQENMPQELIFVCLFQSTVRHIGPTFRTLYTFKNWNSQHQQMFKLVTIWDTFALLEAFFMIPYKKAHTKFEE